MNLFFSAITDSFSHKTLIGLVNSTLEIKKVLIIYKGHFEFKFNRPLEIIALSYDKILIGNYGDYESGYKLTNQENDFLKRFSLEILYMMNRIHRLHSYSFSDRYQMLKNHFHGSVGLFNNFNPDLCFFVNMPHEVFDYVLFKVAEFRNLNRRYLMHGMQLETYYQILENINGNDQKLSNYSNCEDKLSKNMLHLYEKYSNPDLKHFYMDNDYAPIYRKFSGLAKVRFWFLTHLKFLTFITKRGLLIKYLLINILYHKYETLKSKFFVKKKLLKNIDLNTKFIYVPLHYEPELTTSPLGGIFFDQIEMIDLLNRNCPEGYKILVKDHPKQRINFGRDFNFFKHLSRLENVVYLNKEIENKVMLNHSEIIATISGTVGFEALCKNKTVLVFGEPFYMHYEGAFKINNDKDFIGFIKEFKKKGIPNKSNFYKFLNHCEKNFYYGFMDMEYAHLSSLNLEDNVTQLVSNIKNSFKI